MNERSSSGDGDPHVRHPLLAGRVKAREHEAATEAHVPTVDRSRDRKLLRAMS